MPEQRPDGPRDDFAGPESGPEPPYPIKLRGPVIKGFGRGSRELGIPTANIPPSGLDAYPDLQSGVYFGFVGLKVTPETTQPADNSALTLSGSSEAGTGGRSSTSGPATGANAGVAGHGRGGSTGIGVGVGVGVYPAVLSIGYNPFYKNAQRSIEIHILHAFPTYNFYHSALNLLILGFIRPEYDYNSLDALVDDIKCDCEVARRSLARDGYAVFAGRESKREREEDENKGTTANVHDDAAGWLRDFHWWEGVKEDDVRRLEERETGADRDGEGEGGEGEERDGGKL